MKEQLFISAGGKGLRMGELTRNKPKALVEIRGKPIIDHVIEAGKRAGVDHVVVRVAHMKDQIMAHLPEADFEENGDPIINKSLFHSIQTRRPDLVIGVNGDTLIHTQSLKKIKFVMEQHPEADAAVLLTKVNRPIFESNWTFWRPKIEGERLVAMEEVLGHLAAAEHIATAFKSSSLEKLTDNYTEFYDNLDELPFTVFSFQWYLILRLLLWKEFNVIGIMSDDLCLNINSPRDVKDAECFFDNPSLFRFNKLTPDRHSEPILTEQSYVLTRNEDEYPDLNSDIENQLRRFGLSIIDKRFAYFEANDVCQLTAGKISSPEAITARLIEGAGACYKAKLIAEEVNGPLSNRTPLVFSSEDSCSLEDFVCRQKKIINSPL